MKTLIATLLLTVTALVADPAPIARPEQILALIPDETRPRGKKEWDALSLETAGAALAKELSGRPAVLALRVRQPSGAPKREQFLVSCFTDQFDWRGRSCFVAASTHFPAKAIEQIIKIREKPVKIAGTITSCTLQNRGGVIEIGLGLENCELK